MEQARTALLAAWLIVSAAIVPVLAAPFLVPPRTLLSLMPPCQSKVRYGRECALCGMTRGFILISRGRFDDALRRNRASIPLYAALLWNEFLASWFVLESFRPRPRLQPTEEVPCRS